MGLQVEVGMGGGKARWLGWLAAGTGLVLLAGCGLGQPRRNAHVPMPVKAVALDRYLGRWYEQARYDSWFERGCEAATADYATRPDGLVGVVNACRQGGVDGRLEMAAARARVVPGSGNARLRVAFFGPLFIGNYWVLDHADDYSWSIVGEPSGGYLWILTRARVLPAGVLDGLLGRAGAMGYDTARLHMTRQVG